MIMFIRPKIAVSGYERYGESHRYGFVLSFEKRGFFIIIHWNHLRKWIGLANINLSNSVSKSK